LDEIHTYRGNKATQLKYLLARLKAGPVGPIVQVGTSATLQSSQIEGYLKGDEDRLGRFIKPLFDVENIATSNPSTNQSQSRVLKTGFYPSKARRTWVGPWKPIRRRVWGISGG
jgi:hypothetical protein